MAIIKVNIAKLDFAQSAKTFGFLNSVDYTSLMTIILNVLIGVMTFLSVTYLHYSAPFFY